MHLESSPIYDRHVLAFFGESPPPASLEKEQRIAWYLDFLGFVARSYQSWATDPAVSMILSRLKLRDGQLAECDPIRLIDILVWKVGNQKLLVS